MITLILYATGVCYAVGSAANAVKDFGPKSTGETVAVALFGVIWAPLFVLWSIWVGSVGWMLGHGGPLLSRGRWVW
jgi:hypothetical protein